MSEYAKTTDVSQSINSLNTTLTGLISAETNARTEALKEKAHTFTVETTGSGNAVTNVSYSNNKITATKGATYLTAHPSITKETDSTSKVSPAHQESFTTIDSVTRDSNGHVTKLNTKTVTLPAETQLSKGTDSNTTAALTHGGTFTVLTDVAVDGHKITDHTKTFTMPSETVLSKGTDTSDTAQTLKFGDTFTAMVDTAVEGHKITDKNKTFTMPSFPAAGSDLGGVKTGGDVTISNGVITVKDDSHNHVISNVDGLQDTLNSKANKNAGVFYIEGTGDTAGTWLGSHSDIGSYYSGLMIAYKVGIAGADATTLNINNLGAKTVKMNASTAVTTHYGVNSVLFLVYTVDSDGVGYWKLADYNSDKKVSQYSTTTNAKYPMLFKYTSGNTSTSTVTNYVRYNNNIYYNPSGGVLTAPKFEGAVIGNADTASAVQTSSGNLKFWKGTKAEYDAIATKDASCLYIVTDDMPVKQTWTLTMTDGRIIEKDVILYD